MRRRSFLIMATLIAAIVGSTLSGATVRADDDRAPVILATTTSTADSGLLDVLLPAFTAATGYDVKPIAVGSGAALELGAKGEADVLLVHSPAAEETFMTDGHGIDRALVMYNDFVIVGPASDPAAIAGSATAVEALGKIAATGAPFISRGDDSGTHKLELKLWAAATVEPTGSWYVQSGTGMGETLAIANERQAYTITDRGTFLAVGDDLDLGVLVEGDLALLNPYRVITVNPEGHSAVNVDGGQAFFAWIQGEEAQAIIATFGTEAYGTPLFTPCVANACQLFPVPTDGTPVASPTA